MNTTELLATPLQCISLDGMNIAYRTFGEGPPLLLLHGYPQTHVMWAPVVEQLAPRFTLVCPDLRGYGDSGRPADDSTHFSHSKRATARDQVALMRHLGHERFAVAGHDRGARVAHRMALDHPEHVTRLAVLDIVPTRDVFRLAGKETATAYYHWFFLIQPDGLPEHLIGLDPDYYLRGCLQRWSRVPDAFDPVAVDEYLRCFRDPGTIHATCEDYRAGAGVDLEHDEADLDSRIECPLLVLWGARGFVGQAYDVEALWQARARHPIACAAPDCGHFVVEEAPEATARALLSFFPTA